METIIVCLLLAVTAASLCYQFYKKIKSAQSGGCGGECSGSCDMAQKSCSDIISVKK